MKQNNNTTSNGIEKMIEITQNTPTIQPKGIKLELYLHQKVLVQKILDIIQHKIKFYDSQNVLINNKNIWLKSSIGTGKSLILLSVIQELKNNGYKQIDCSKIPVRNSLLYMVEHYDRNLGINYLSKDCFYYKLLNSNIFRMEMNKAQGYYVEGHKKIVINYPSFKKQVLIFCQHQVIGQFEEYIETQTSLTYKSIKDGENFIKFALSDEEFSESNTDVILYDTNQLEPQVYLTNASSYIRVKQEQEGEDTTNELNVFNSKIAQIQQRYKNVQSFNDFWQMYQQYSQYPYAIIAYDDFDLIKFPNHFPLESIWNVFVGSTMIKMSLQNSNVCANFIMNKFIHNKTSLRIKEEQIQRILRLPKCHYKNIICYTPNQVYVQFKCLLYMQSVFQLLQQVFIPQKDQQTYKPKIISIQEYQQILANQLTFYDIFDQFLLQYRLPFKNVADGKTIEYKQILNPKQQYSVWYLIDYIEYVKQLYEMNILCQELKQRRIPQEQIQEYVNELFNLLPEPLSLFISNTPQDKLDIFFNNLQQHQFQMLQEEIDANKLFNPFTNHQDLDVQQLVLCRCCGQLFNEKDIEKALFYEEGKLKCSFCLQYTNDPNIQFLKLETQRYIKFDAESKDKVQFSEKFIENLDISPISKDQILLKQIKECKAANKRILLYSNNINNLNNLLQKEQVQIDDVYKHIMSLNVDDLTIEYLKEYFLDLFQNKFFKVLNYGQINNFKNIIFTNIRFTINSIIQRIRNQQYQQQKKEDDDTTENTATEKNTADKSTEKTTNKSTDKPQKEKDNESSYSRLCEKLEGEEETYEEEECKEDEQEHSENDQQKDDQQKSDQQKSDLLKQFENGQKICNKLTEFVKSFKQEDINNTADIILVQSLDQIIGANITYVDVFIFYDVPQTTEEIYQVIGRSRRIGRKNDIESYQYYYPLSKKLNLDI